MSASLQEFHIYTKEKRGGAGGEENGDLSQHSVRERGIWEKISTT